MYIYKISLYLSLTHTSRPALRFRQCARVVAGRVNPRFRPLFYLHDRQLRQLSRNLMSVTLICCPL